jgi:hypothetical protein
MVISNHLFCFFILLAAIDCHIISGKRVKNTRIKINKAKATFTGRSLQHIQVGHPEGTKPKPGVEIRAVKGEGRVMCEII